MTFDLERFLRMDTIIMDVTISDFRGVVLQAPPISLVLIEDCAKQARSLSQIEA